MNVVQPANAQFDSKLPPIPGATQWDIIPVHNLPFVVKVTLVVRSLDTALREQLTCTRRCRWLRSRSTASAMDDGVQIRIGRSDSEILLSFDYF